MAYNNYFPTGYNPYGFQPVSAPFDGTQQYGQGNIQGRQATPQSGLIWVQGLDEAERYPLAPNTAIVLWDINDPCVYRKQADATGKPTLKIYDLIERNVSDVKKKAEYPTLDAFNDLKDEVRKIKEALNSHASESST